MISVDRLLRSDYPSMKMSENLFGYQRAELFRQAHHLNPVASVGKEGVTEAVLTHIRRELETHELIKVRFTDYKTVRKDLIEDIAASCEAILVGMIGHIGILYKQSANPENRKIFVPER